MVDGAVAGQGGDVLDAYLADLAGRCGPAAFKAVVAAVSDTCAMLSGGHTAVLAGPDGTEFAPCLQREYLGSLAVLMTGRTDLEVIAMLAADGTAGWAVVEPETAAVTLAAAVAITQ
ncbi:hypothetical protein ABZ743_32405 [Streptomyces sp. NPDC006662]|uniref:hypothetical protein n=1 Tax=Streptomyces sp. NPDC006662 TaxID=3156902 RepID=UPI003401348F